MACPRAQKGHYYDIEMIFFSSKMKQEVFENIFGKINLKKNNEYTFQTSQKNSEIFEHSNWKFFSVFPLYSLSISIDICCPHVPMGMPIILTSGMGISWHARYGKLSVPGITGIANALLFCKQAGKSGHRHAF